MAKHDLHLAKHLQLELQKNLNDSTFDIEMLLGELEDNQWLAESLKTEPKSLAKSGKGESASFADKKGCVQLSANPAIQQQAKCSICGNENCESKCPKEIDRLKKAAQRCTDEVSGADKSTKRDRKEVAAVILIARRTNQHSWQR